MQDKVDIHLQRLTPQGADGVGAHWRAALGIEATPGFLPGALLGQLRWLAVGAGKENLDALVGGQGVHLRDVVAAEDKAAERWAQANDCLELDVEHAVATGPGRFANQLAQAVAQSAGQGGGRGHGRYPFAENSPEKRSPAQLN
ncbi:hypothetical protein D9M71_368300 [compost metagenome]